MIVVKISHTLWKSVKEQSEKDKIRAEKIAIMESKRVTT